MPRARREREQVSVSPLIAQLQPSPPAFAIELNDAAGNGSVTVIGEPSVGELPAFATAIVNVVGWPPTRFPVWLLAIVSEGAETVLTTCGDDVLERRSRA